MSNVVLLLAGLTVAAHGAEERSFSLDWFRTTPEYTALVAAAAEPDPIAPGVTLTKAEVDEFLERVRVTDKELKWVKRYASPLSPRRQRKRVRSVIDVLTSRSRLRLGRKFAVEHEATLAKVSKTYGVTVEDLLAMMNTESRFGQVQGSFLVGQVFVATMAYLEPMRAAAQARGDYDKKGAVSAEKNLERVERRTRYAVKNLATLLKYAEKRNMDPLAFRGSWAGAIGITQFMPASLKWAVDGDDNGIIDLSTFPDAIASTANYLVEHGYRAGDRKARAASFSAYNPNDEYVRAILAYSEKIAKK